VNGAELPVERKIPLLAVGGREIVRASVDVKEKSAEIRR